MGINGLLKGLQSFSKKCHVTDFENQVLAVDASSWFHKSVYSIAEEYVEAVERSKTRHDPSCVKTSSRYMISRCTELLDHGAKIKGIYLVMDGKRCPLKAQTNEDREDRRKHNLKDARRYKIERKKEKSQDKYKACIKIHSSFADAVAKEIQSHFATKRDNRVKVIHSPYEADSQLVKLCVDGFAQAIVTEDSDVLLYCAACQISIPILYKLERRGANVGACDVISMDWLLNPKPHPEQNSQDSRQKDSALDSILKSLCSRQRANPGKGVRIFVQACVLAGSDYSPSLLSGVGLVTAFKLVRDQSHKSCDERFHHVLLGLSTKQKGNIDMIAYEQNLARSEAVFFFHPVLQVDTKKIIHLNILKLTKTELNHFSDFHPCLDRFGHDLWFLGRLDGRDADDLRSPDAARVATTEPTAPMTSIFIRKLSTRKRNHETQTDSDLVDHQYVEGVAKQNVKIMNPYVNSRKALVPIDTNRQPESGPSNPFASFSHKKFSEEPPKAENSYKIYDQKGDVRYAKRKFSKDAKPIGKIIDYAKAKAALLRPQQCSLRPQILTASDIFAKHTKKETIDNNCHYHVENLDSYSQCNIIDVDENLSSALRSHSCAPSGSPTESFVNDAQAAFQTCDGDDFAICPQKSVPTTSRTAHKDICLVDNDDYKLRRTSRRVTLDSPQRNEINEFNSATDRTPNVNVDEFDNLRQAKRCTRGSPGECSVLSEIDDLECVGMSRLPFCQTEITPGDKSDGFAEVEMRPTENATPFQTNRTLADKLSQQRTRSILHSMLPRQTSSKPFRSKPSPLQAGFELQIAKHAKTTEEAELHSFRFGGRCGLDIRRVTHLGKKQVKVNETISSFFNKSKPEDIWDDF